MQHTFSWNNSWKWMEFFKWDKWKGMNATVTIKYSNIIKCNKRSKNESRIVKYIPWIWGKRPNFQLQTSRVAEANRWPQKETEQCNRIKLSQIFTLNISKLSLNLMNLSLCKYRRKDTHKFKFKPWRQLGFHLLRDNNFYNYPRSLCPF